MKDILSLLNLARPHWVVYSIAVFSVICMAALFLFVPNQIGELVASLRTISTGDDDRAAGIVFAIVAVMSLQSLIGVAHTFFVSLAAERIVNKLRADFFRVLISQRLDLCSSKQLGEIASEFASDLSLIHDGISGTLINFLRNSLLALGAFIALFLISFKMTLIALGGIGAVSLIILLFIRAATRSIVAIQQNRSKVMALLLEAASNVYVIQAYKREDYMRRRFSLRLDEMFARVRRHLLLMAGMNPVSLVAFSAVMASVILYGINEVRGSRISVGELIAYVSYAIALVASACQVGYLGGRLRQAGAMVRKHRHMLTPTPETPTADVARSDNTGASNEEFYRIGGRTRSPFGFVAKDLTFSYSGSKQPVLNNLSFHIPTGKVTAIVGESGAGKSTLIRILCGLYQPTRGAVQRVWEDGAVAAMPPSPSPNVALVPQEPCLFAGTIAENIIFGRDSLTLADVQRAAMSARIHEYIVSLPEGYDTKVEEAGNNLSRGQRQRLAIARALVGKPGVLIFDEATASLDVVSERAIKELIDDLRGEVTIIIVAHQGALLSDIDHVIHIGRGGSAHPNMEDRLQRDNCETNRLNCYGGKDMLVTTGLTKPVGIE